MLFITNKDGLNDPMRVGVPTRNEAAPFTALDSRVTYLNGSGSWYGDLVWQGMVRVNLDHWQSRRPPRTQPMYRRRGEYLSWTNRPK